MMQEKKQIARPALRLDELQFDNRFIKELPADPEPKNFRRQVHRSCYSRVFPTSVPAPKRVAYSSEVAELLNISLDELESDQFVSVFSGNQLLPGMDPFAMCYGGHQFGNWAGQLGDGRAINLGEVVNQNNEHWTLQLKGAGPTPYSRTADGLAVLRSSVREFLCSEAMYHLGVPTTRALSLVITGQNVLRDMFYDGNAKMEPGAIVCRVAPSFTRFGNFEIFASRNDVDTLKQLTDFTLRNDFPHIGPPSEENYAAMFREVCETTAEMIVHWMRVGFVHGVMNTDNMSILGLTIDYGPYGWLEDYDPNWTPNTTDAAGRRYRFANQPQIAMWNLMQLANALSMIVPDTEKLQEGLNQYAETFKSSWQLMMASKLGLQSFRSETDEALVYELLELLQLVETDMTIFFRSLSTVTDSHFENCYRVLGQAYYRPEQITEEYEKHLSDWIGKYLARTAEDGLTADARREKMNLVNPKYVLRNYLAQMAIDKATEGDYQMISELLDVLRNPYEEQSSREMYSHRRPDWARERAGCSMLSCSS